MSDGLVSFESLTASVVSGGVKALFAAMVIAAASDQALSDVEASFSKLTATAQVASGTAYTVVTEFEEQTAVVLGPDEITPSFEALSASATGIVGTLSTVAATFSQSTVAITYVPVGLSSGNGVFSYSAATVVSSQYAPVTAEGAFSRLYGAGQSVAGVAITSEATFKKLTASVSSTPPTTGAATAAFEWQVASITSAPTLAETFSTWVVNTRNLNITEYTNFSFNSFAEFNGTVYAAGAAGVMKLEGTDDDGTAIQAVARLGAVGDTKENYLSRIPEVVIAGATAAPISVTIFQENGTSFSYETKYTGIDTLRQIRVTPGKGLRSTRFKVQFSNNNGQAFELGPTMINTIPVSRRLGG